MLRRLLPFVWAGLMVAAISSCEGPQGEVGPAGAKGDTGAQGPAGPAGQDGEGGGGGGGLLITTGAIPTDSTGGFFAGLEITTPEVDTLLQTSAVLVYIKAQDVYWPVPGRVVFAQNAASQFNYVYGIQENVFFVDIFQTAWSETASTTPPARNAQDVRIVIIPNTVIGRINAETLKSYEKTIQALELEDEMVQVNAKLNFKPAIRK